MNREGATLAEHLTRELRRLHLESGWNVSELARRLGLQRPMTLRLLGKGEYAAVWKSAHIEAMASAFGLTPRDLMPIPPDAADARPDTVRRTMTELHLALAEHAQRQQELVAAVLRSMSVLDD